MELNKFIYSIENKDFNRIRNSKSDAEARRVLLELAETKQCNIDGVISRFLGLFKLSCPKCKNGNLKKDFVRCYPNGTVANGYICDKCNEKTISGL